MLGLARSRISKVSTRSIHIIALDSGCLTNVGTHLQDDALMDSSGHITTLGQQYIGAIIPNISSNYQPGVVHGGNGNTSSGGGNSGNPSISAALLHYDARFVSIGTVVAITAAALLTL